VVETGGLEKIKSSLRYLIENPIKSLCQLQDSEVLSFRELLSFCSFCATFSDNLVTLERFSLSRT
jgi:hypothetical protein